MAPARSGRKGWRLAFSLVALLGGSAIVAFPITVLGTFLLTPMLGRLETRYGIELVGHSGPSDWIFEAMFGVGTAVVFGFLVLFTRRVRHGPEGPGAPRSGGGV